MIELSKEHIEAIRRSEILIEHVKSYLESSFWLMTMALEDMPRDAFDELYDACWHALRNDAPVVEEILAEQDKGVYSIDIRGIPGAYFTTAPEYDDRGPFSTLEDARDEIDTHFGEFLVSGEDDDEDEEEDAEEEPQDPSSLVKDELLVPLLTGRIDPDELEALRNRILGNKIWYALAVADINFKGGHPAGLDEVVRSFASGLPKPTSMGSDYHQKSRLRKLPYRVNLFFRLRRRLPDCVEMSVLYDVD